MSRNATNYVTINDVEVDFDSLKICVAGNWLDIEARQCTLLKLLLDNHGEAVSRDQIMDTLWQDTIVSDNSVSQAVTQLRRSLQDDKGTPRFIKTVPRIGYQLIATVIYPQPTEKSPVTANKNILYTIGGISLVVGIALTLAISNFLSPALEVPSYQYQSRLTSVPGPENFLRYSPDGRYLAFSQSSERRDQMDLAIYDAHTQSIHAIRSTGYSEQAPEWSSDGEWLAYYRQDPISCEIRVMRVTNPVETWRMSPDGFLAECPVGYSRQKMHWLDNELYVQQWQQGQSQLIKYTLANEEGQFFPQVSEQVTIAEVSPLLFDIDKASKEMLYVERNRLGFSLNYRDLRSKRSYQIEQGLQEYAGLKWHQTGQSFWLGNESLRLVSINGDSEIVHLPLGFIGDLDLNPVTKQLAHAEGMANVNLYALTLNSPKHDGGIHQRQLSSSARTDVLPAVSPDGLQTAFVSYQRRAVNGDKHIELWLKHKNKQTATLLANVEQNIQLKYLLWSPDGEYLLLGDSQAKVYLVNIYSKQLIPIITDHQNVAQVNWSADGQFVHFVSDQQQAKSWRYNLKLSVIEPDEQRDDMAALSVENMRQLNPSFIDYSQRINQFLTEQLGYQLPVDDLLPSLSLYRPYVYQQGIYYVVKEGHRLNLYRYSFAEELNEKISEIGRFEQDINLQLNLSASDDGQYIVLSKIADMETDILVQQKVQKD